MRGTRILMTLATTAFVGLHAGLARSALEGREASRATRSPVVAGDRLPLAFEENRGQANDEVRFVVRPRGMTAFLHDAGATFVSAPTFRAPEGRPYDPDTAEHDPHRDVLRMEVVGASPRARAHGVGHLPGVSNYLIGNDAKRWLRDVPHRRRAATREVLDGVDLVWREADNGGLAFDLRVAPGADPNAVRLRLTGGGRVDVADDGELTVQGERGTWRLSRPVAFQDFGGERMKVAASFAESDDGSLAFDIGDHDAKRPLVIDPDIRYLTYVGGSGGSTVGRERARDMSLGSQDNVFFAGTTESTNFPTASAYLGSFQGNTDAVVCRLNAQGTSLVYSTYFGGSGDDSGFDVAVDSSGRAHLAGGTNSSNLPLASPIDATLGGSRDGYVAVFSASGGSLLFSTLFGGSGQDSFNSVELDSSGAIYGCGTTRSTTGFPAVSAVQSTHGGGWLDAFVTKLDRQQGLVVYSTYLGGSGDEGCRGLAVDSAGRAHVTGSTQSTNFPVSSAEQSSFGGGTTDAYLTKLAANGASFVYSTFIGGSAEDDSQSVALHAGAAVVCGTTASMDFPTTSAAFQTVYGGGTLDCFVTKFNAAGSSHAYSTYVGGGTAAVTTEQEMTKSLVVSSSGVAHVVGWAATSDFPTVDAAQSTYGGGTYDGIVFALAADGSSLVYSTYVGGSGRDELWGVGLTSGGAVVFTGASDSTSGLSTSGAYQATNAGGFDAIVGSLGATSAPDAPSDLAATVSTEQQVDLTWSDSDGLESSFELQRATASGAFAALATLAVNSESYSDTTASGSTAYRYRIRAVNDVGPSDWSNIATATTPSPPPTSVAGVSTSNRSVTLTWSDDADDETGYIVERASGCPGVTWAVIATLPPNSTSYTDNTVQPETQYSYRVRTMGSDASSTPSLEVCVTSGPANPTSLLAITQSDSAVLLRWSDTSAIETAFEIERTATGGAAEIAASVSANTADHTDETVAPETEYTYRVRARTPDATSSWSPAATTRTAPAAPSEPFGVAISSSRVRLTWQDNSQVEQGFEVRRRIHGGGGEFALVERVPRNNTSFLDGGLLQETAYDYTVNAYDSSGDSNPIAIDELATTAVLVIRKVKLKAAKKKPASLKVQAEIDFGGFQPDATDDASIGVNGVAFSADSVIAKNNGRVLEGAGDGVSFKLTRKSATASRGKLKITITGAAAEVDGDSELTIAYTTDGFTAAGSIELSAGRFDLKKGVGLRVDPDVVPSKLRLKLGGLESDTLQLAATFEPTGTLPDEIPNALVTVGDARLVFSGETAERNDKKLRFTYRLTDMPQATLTVDYAKGTIKLTAKKIELGDYPTGDVPTLLDLVVGDLRWRDVPVLRSKGKSASY